MAGKGDDVRNRGARHRHRHSGRILSRIGQAFEQASNDPMLAREGTGLGLALVKALVGRHGGVLEVESCEGVGTTIMVRLPRRQHQLARAAA